MGPTGPTSIDSTPEPTKLIGRARYEDQTDLPSHATATVLPGRQRRSIGLRAAAHVR